MFFSLTKLEGTSDRSLFPSGKDVSDKQVDLDTDKRMERQKSDRKKERETDSHIKCIICRPTGAAH